MTIGIRCLSWLLDPQLASYLPERSNIVQFQRRFQLMPTMQTAAERADTVMLEYVFDRIHNDAHIDDALLTSLPQRSTLERAFVSHLRAGRYWYNRAGWFPADCDAIKEAESTATVPALLERPS